MSNSIETLRDLAMKAREKFEAWAKDEGYDTAGTYDTERSRWVWLNPMTADLYVCWLASRKAALEEAAQAALGAEVGDGSHDYNAGAWRMQDRITLAIRDLSKGEANA